MRSGAHIPVDVQDAAVDANVERPARRERQQTAHDAVLPSDGFGRIAQDRKPESERVGKPPVPLGRVGTCRKVGDVELPDSVAAPTERPAFRRSPARERARKPREYDGLPSNEVRQPIRAPVRAWQLEERRRIARLQATVSASCHLVRVAT
jgi:hypothetical protein